MDTPGVLWPKFEDPDVGLKLACTGAVSDNVVDKIALAENLIKLLAESEKEALEARYKIECKKWETPEDARQILTDIGEARGFKMKGGIVDIERAAIILLDEFRGGKLGRISLEKP
jgi:ribosome biogenesis GTPase A